MTLILYLLRHAQGTHNVNFYKVKGNHWNDPLYIDAELTAEGFKQTQKVQGEFKEIKFSAIFCSPLRRCRNTLLAVLPESESFPVTLDDRLLELPLGLNLCDRRLEREEILKTCPESWITKQVGEKNPCEPQTSNYELSLIQDFIVDVRRKNIVGNILLVSHGNWIERFLHVYKLKPQFLENCQYIKVTL